MWRWLGILASLCFSVFLISSASAATTSEVTITATGANVTTCDPPTNLSLTVLSDVQIRLSWTPASGAATTIIRGEFDRAPANITSGFAVYNDVGSTTTFDVDTNRAIFFRAWSDCGGGLVSTTFAEASLGSGRFLSLIGMAFLSLIPLILAAMGIHWKKAVFMISGAFFWIGVAAVGWSASSTNYDAFHIWAMMSLGMCLAWLLGIFWMGHTEIGDALEDLETEGFDQWGEEMKKFEKDRGMRRRDEDEEE